MEMDRWLPGSVILSILAEIIRSIMKRNQCTERENQECISTELKSLVMGLLDQLLIHPVEESLFQGFATSRFV